MPIEAEGLLVCGSSRVASPLLYFEILSQGENCF